MKKVLVILAAVGLILPGILLSQVSSVNVSGIIKDNSSEDPLPFVNVLLKSPPNSTFITGTITSENGLFAMAEVLPGEYIIEVSYTGYDTYSAPLFIGSTSAYIDLGAILLDESVAQLDEVVVTGQQDAISGAMGKKTYSLEENLSQSGGSILQSMNNLPGITVQDGQIQLRGNNQVAVLIDGKQTAMTGFGNQNGLDNIPASAVDKIEIINNPSAKFDASGNAGIVNIILKKENQEGFNGKAGLTAGLGALWERKDNLSDIQPQYRVTPKINPSISINYRTNRINLFLQADNLYTETLNKNEFATRTYENGSVISQQLLRNRNTNFFTSKAGFDWFVDDHNTLTISGLYSQEAIKDYGDQPFHNKNSDERLRLWQFFEDEVLTAAMASLAYEHRFPQPGHKLNLGFNYTFDREDEKYFFTNTTPSFSNEESFFLIADQKVVDLTLDYIKPTKHGLLETGIKFRRRTIPTDMQFNPAAENTALDVGADGSATYEEVIPAVYGNYIFELRKLEAELGLRVEYVDLKYDVDPGHNTYQSDGYDYLQPFPSARITYKLDDRNKISAFYNRRVDRPDEVDIRIFPKYDDAEIIKVGNPGLQPQFTNSFETGYKNTWDQGYFYGAVYHRIADGTITRIASTDGSSNLIYAISQNAGKSYNTGIELVITQELSNEINMNLNLNGYRNQIDAFTVINQYPVQSSFTSEKQEILSGNIKWNINYKLAHSTEAQMTVIFLAPDIIPQGRIDSRFSVDAGIKKTIQNGRGELFLNATDILNTMVIQKNIEGNDFRYITSDYYETQVVRVGYGYAF